MRPTAIVIAFPSEGIPQRLIERHHRVAARRRQLTHLRHTVPPRFKHCPLLFGLFRPEKVRFALRVFFSTPCTGNFFLLAHDRNNPAQE